MFSQLASVYEELERTASGNKLRQILSQLFKKTSKDEVDKVAYLTLGSIASEYEDVNMGMAEKMVLRSIARATGKSQDEINHLFKKKGDIGIVAEAMVGRKRKELSVKEVFETLHKIASATGFGSQERKTELLANLLKNASAKEARYLARIVLGTLRLGVGDKTILDALGIAFTGTKAHKARIEHAYNICPDVGIIAKTIAKKGLKGIDKIEVALGRPIQMMLCQRVGTLSEVEKHMDFPIAVEEKYDGERIQVHKKGSNIVLFSRRLENITHQFPDVVAEIKKNVKAKDCVIEGEVMAVDKKGNLLPFQVLMQRRRKYKVEEYIKKIPVCLFLFELLYLKGKSYIRRSYPERQAALQKIVKESQGLKLAVKKICKNTECAEELFNQTIQRGGEGIVIKSLAKDSVYKAGVRGWSWIKWKPEYAKELRDTFDLVVIGAFHGRGKRAGTYGALLCAAYNDKEDRFETFCKLGSGFTDKELEELPSKFKKYAIKHKPARVKATKAMEPDIWFDPNIVLEVIGSEITRSPNHACAIEKGQGLALRFPRFLHYRHEKAPEQATTAKEILQLFTKRTRKS